LVADVIRPSLAVLSGLFLLQLSLQASGTWCAMHRGAGRNGVGMNEKTEMPGMSRDVAAHASVSAMLHGDAPTSSGDCGGMGQHNDCGLPSAPGQCQSMTACGVGANPVERTVLAAVTRAVRVDLLSPALLHSGPTFAPELPPPRA
jgi:hypothetical protein